MGYTDKSRPLFQSILLKMLSVSLSAHNPSFFFFFINSLQILIYIGTEEPLWEISKTIPQVELRYEDLKVQETQ